MHKGPATTDYEDFLRAKVAVAPLSGFEIDASAIHPILKPHQRVSVQWALRGGRRALFQSFGLGKTLQQLELMRLVAEHTRGRTLIVAPLGVRQEFRRDAIEKLGWTEGPKFIRTIEEADRPGVYITNYEPVRDGKLDPAAFEGSTLDEASVLRGFGGTKTFREFMRLFEQVPYRFVATATPAPNEYIEILAYAAYLGIMDVGQAKTRFFKRNSEKADELTIHPHKEREFWLWVASWALFLQRPSDLGFSDEGYELPPLIVEYHEVKVDHSTALPDKAGQGAMFREATHGVVEAAREKRDTLPQRIAAMLDIVDEYDENIIIWHDLEAERHAIEHELPGVAAVYGSQDLEIREQIVADFADGMIPYLAAKPVMLGSGCNLQRHCHRAIFLGIGFKFSDFIQAIHRIFRFLQTEQVTIHIIYAESERQVLLTLKEKWLAHEEMVRRMSEIIREYGLAEASIASAMQRSMGVERTEVVGDSYRLANNDTVLETRRMEENSVGLVLTSIPFSTQYEYTPSYNDFGHSESNEQFFEQMDYLTPELLRVVQPGRLAVIHVKDRIVPGGMTGLGFQTVYPFHVRCIEHYMRHGFAYMGMKTIVTDVVRENNQTYRLGWTEQCKDGSKMGCGMPEYLLLFRKPPTDNTRSYADLPVVKSKADYSRSRWQVDAHGFARSSGNRLLDPEEVAELTHEAIFKLFRNHSQQNVYDFEEHVAIGEALEDKRILPVTFMLLQPPSWHPDVWTDVTRMLTLNGAQSAKGKEMHLCPMQFDVADRIIAQYSMSGETVYDPFMGIGTVPYRAVLQGRFGAGAELNERYFRDAVGYCESAVRKLNTPSLFDALKEEAIA
ncbi:MAG: DNA methyltransferase [Acidobacteriaceae bacterium]|jgi:hypothetical protein